MSILQPGSEVRASLRLAAVLLLVLGSASCSKPASSPVGSAPLKAATIHELMTAHVDPSADFIWESVSTTVTSAGTQEKRPQTPEEWLTLRRLAVEIVQSADRLAAPGLTVVPPGTKLEDAHIAGISTADDIQHAIAADPPAFASHAHELRAAGAEALAAIDAKNADALITAGGHLDEACEGCHIVYWYPNTRRPPELSAIASR